MALMTWTFSDVYKQVSEFLGLGTSPAGANLTKVKNLTYRGYMKFLMPISPRDQEIYIWSFLQQPYKLAIETNKWEYLLPTDFERFYRPIVLDPDQVTMTLQLVSENEIMKNRNLLEYSSYPHQYAIRTGKFDSAVGSTKELIMYPTPTTSIVANCTYVMAPPKPTEDADYFIGGQLESDVIMQCALAVAENEEDEVIGVETQRAVEMIQALIRKDKGIAPDTVGRMRDSNIDMVSTMDYRALWIPKGTFTVYGFEV
jgi:hypothetical protein